MAQMQFTCGLEAALAVISGKWKPLIVFHLAKGTKRYGELKRCIPGVSDKVLGQQLKDLQADGLIRRVDYGEIPPRVDYSLTPFGSSLADAFLPLCQWGEANTAAIQKVARRRER